MHILHLKGYGVCDCKFFMGKYTKNSALDISKYIISKCVEKGYPISNMQLQEILYYVQKDFLNRNGIAFLDDFEAWEIGPVIPEVYNYFCGYGAMPISIIWYDTPEISELDKLLIDRVIEQKSLLGFWNITNEIQKPDGAWDRIFLNGIGEKCIIPIELIKKDVF